MAAAPTPVSADLPPDVAAGAAVEVAAVQALSGNGNSPVSSDLPPDVGSAAVPLVDNPASAASLSSAEVPLFLKDGAYREEPDESSLPEQPLNGIPPVPLDNQRIYGIVREVASAHSGEALYSAVSADTEFTTAGHAAAGRRHLGLAFGIVLFTQESGQLGSVLSLWHRRSPAGLSGALGPDANVLMETLGRPDPAGRLATVAGESLWSPGWVERFRAAGADTDCQAAQNEQAIERQFRPMSSLAFELGLDTDRAMAMAYDVVVSRGAGGGGRWIAECCGPFRTAAERASAVAAVGCSTLAGFQAANDLEATGRFSPKTHARLAQAVRRLGTLPLPTASELAARMVAASNGPAKARLERLWSSPAFADVALAEA